MRRLTVLIAVLLAAAAGAAAATPAAAAPTVCALHCDTRDPSPARQESIPVPEVNLNGRRLVLHVSDTDRMAWASIDNGVSYATGTVVTYAGARWQCRQPHLPQVGWEPPNVPALWLRL